ncbi:hypothetical protein NIA70_20300, partial [[Clostridium] scindens]|uniref:hypothetical protein n=1 Tax=Clostridium scindens (strain JCM 10418 / VPI 12708) TaxID=29347 RepID=UPI0020979644
VGNMPGLSGLSVDVDGSDAGGNLNINTHHLVVDAPGELREPLSFDTLTGQVGWRRCARSVTCPVFPACRWMWTAVMRAAT